MVRASVGLAVRDSNVSLGSVSSPTCFSLFIYEMKKYILSFGGQAPPRLLNDCYGNALVSSCWLLNDCCSSPVVGSRCLAAGQIVSPVTFGLPGLAAHRIHDYKLPKSMATKSFGGQFDLCSSCISSALPPLMEEEMSGTNFWKAPLVVKYKPQTPGPPG